MLLGSIIAAHLNLRPPAYDPNPPSEEKCLRGLAVGSWTLYLLSPPFHLHEAYMQCICVYVQGYIYLIGYFVLATQGLLDHCTFVMEIMS